MTTTIQTATRTVLATATGSAAAGYYPTIKARNGRVIWEGQPYAFRAAAHDAAVARAGKMD
jgi:hypothetical protein